MSAIHKLTDKSVQVKRGPGLTGDGGGLYIKESESGSKSWVFRYRNRFNAKQHQMGLGAYGPKDVCLAEARDKAAFCRAQLREGLDPLQEKKRQRGQVLAGQEPIPTFKECSAQYIESRSAGWKNPKSKQQWTNTLKTYADPVIGDLPVNMVSDDHVFRILDAIWLTKNDTASKLKGRIKHVLLWAEAHGHRTGPNPARDDGPLSVKLLKPGSIKSKKHSPSLPYPQLFKFLTELKQQKGIAAKALNFKIVTATRTREILGAKWPEFDLDTRVWTIPGERMKAGIKHRVALSEVAVEILEQQKVFGDIFVFPGLREGKPLSNMSMRMLLRRMNDYFDSDGRLIVPHGFRSTFKTWATEQTNYPRQVVEFALAHVNKDTTEAAYLHSDLLQKRVPLMQKWADYGTTEPSSGNVLLLNTA